MRFGILGIKLKWLILCSHRFESYLKNELKGAAKSHGKNHDNYWSCLRLSRKECFSKHVFCQTQTWNKFCKI